MTTRFLFAVLAAISLLFVTSCSTTAYRKIYPSVVSKKVDFNMSLVDFRSLKDVKMTDLKDDTFRWIYLETLENDPKISEIVYYFDKDGDQPLYEMIFIYKDTSVRDEEAINLLGAPNNGEEWTLELKPYTINAWKFKSKLVMAAMIPLTEWNEAAE